MGKRKKNRKLQSIFMTISFILLFVANDFTYSAEHYASDFAMNYIRERSIGFDFIREEEQVKAVEAFLSDNDKVGGYTLYGKVPVAIEEYQFTAVEYMPDIMADFCDKEFEGLKENEVLIPRYYKDSTGTEVDMSEYVGTEVTAVIKCRDWREQYGLKTGTPPEGDGTYTFRVAGVYDNVKAGENYSVYLSKESMKQIFYYFRNIKEGDMESGDYALGGGTSQATVVVNDYDDVKDFYKEFEDFMDTGKKYTFQSSAGEITVKNYNFMLINRNQELEQYRNFFKGLLLLINSVSMILLCSIVANLVYRTKSDMKKRYQEIGILKAIGYTNRDIGKIFLTHYLKVLGIEMTITFILGTGVVYILGDFFRSNVEVFQNADFGVEFPIVILTLLAGVLSVMSGYLTEMLRVRKISPVQALKSVE